MLDNGDNKRGVISMMDRDKDRRFAPVKLVEGYWTGLRVGNSIPLRSQIDPRGIETALEHAFLIERIASTIAKIRVAGTQISQVMGMEVAGMPLSSLLAPAQREEFGRALEQVFTAPAVMKIDLKAESGFGKPALEGHIELFPLRSDFGDVTRALGVMVTNGRIGRAPRRFEIVRITVKPLIGAAETLTEGLPGAKSPQTSALPSKRPEPAPVVSKTTATVSPSSRETKSIPPRVPYKPGPRATVETDTSSAMARVRGDHARHQRGESQRAHLHLIISND